MKLSEVNSPHTQPHQQQHWAPSHFCPPTPHFVWYSCSPCTSNSPWVNRKLGVSSEHTLSLKSSKHEASRELLKTRIPPPRLSYIAVESSFLQVSERCWPTQTCPGEQPCAEGILVPSWSQDSWFPGLSDVGPSLSLSLLSFHLCQVLPIIPPSGIYSILR